MSHLHEEKHNNQGCLMRIVEDNGSSNIVVEFQDEYKYRKHTQYCNFKSGSIRNPYYPSIYGIGITGCKYLTKVNGVSTKEYNAWIDMLKRCFMKNTKDKQPSYKDVECCKKWLNFESFCDWLHEQPNYDKWRNGYRWAIDKDILVKRNKVYSPDACTLVPQNVNCLFLKREAERGIYPIGVRYSNDGFIAVCRNPFLDRSVEIGCYSTPEKAFNAYKIYKEDLIKQVAKIEYESENITEKCYQAMMSYVVEIDD